MSQTDLTITYLGLGANLDDPAGQIRDALHRLDQHPAIKVTAASRLYLSAALVLPGSTEKQADYCNAVAAVATSLPAEALMGELLIIESAMGRKRDVERWGPRRIDLDLLLYGNANIKTPGLTVPHPEMSRRNFVLIPLAEIAPQVNIPGLGTAANLAARISHEGLQNWDESA